MALQDIVLEGIAWEMVQSQKCAINNLRRKKIRGVGRVRVEGITPNNFGTANRPNRNNLEAADQPNRKDQARGLIWPISQIDLWHFALLNASAALTYVGHRIGCSKGPFLSSQPCPFRTHGDCKKQLWE